MKRIIFATLILLSALNLSAQNRFLRLRDDSLRMGSPISINGKYNLFFGDSYTLSVGATDSTKGFPYLVSHAMGMGYILTGSGGGYLTNPPDTSNIPTKTSHMYKAFIEFGINDARQGGGYDSTEFHTRYNLFINSFLRHGWQGSDLVLINISGSQAASAGSYPYVQFNTVISEVAAHYGAALADIWTSMQDPKFGGVDYIGQPGGGVHTNDAGYDIIKWTILAAINPVYKVTNQSGIFSKEVDLSTLVLKDFSPQNNLYPLGVDSLGHVHPMAAIKPNTRTFGRFLIDGNLAGKNALFPTTYDETKDWILTSSTKIFSGLGGSNYAAYEPFDQFTAQTNWWNTHVSAGYNWYYGPSNTIALSINSNGTLIPYKGIVFNGNTNAFLQANNNLLTVETTGGDYLFQNAYTTGTFYWIVSKGVNNATHYVMALNPTGNLILDLSGALIDNGVQFDNTGTTRSQSNLMVGMVPNCALNGNPATSTSGGTLAAATYYYKVIPVDAAGNMGMCNNEGSVTTTGTTSSNTITWNPNATATSFRIFQGTSSNGEGKYITAAAGATSVVDVGSGYTTLALPTGNKTGMANIANDGSTVVPKLTVSSITTGSTPWPQMTTTQRTAISSPTEGSAVYDLTLHKLYVFDGTTWQGAW